MQTYSKTKSKTSREVGLATPNLLELARQELSKKRAFRFQVSGNSMYPSICDGDYVTVEPAPVQKIRAGDIVLMASVSNTALVHRVSKVEERNGTSLMITRGDAANFQDVPIPASYVLGRVTVIEHKDRLVNLNNPFQRLLARLYNFLSRFRSKA
ncbi:MAG: signal peptidase I [Blastocatellia bacterium]|nr:signal peptidase I [Blastocatellia bacterium]